jgi:hypothetical protein
MNRIERGMSMTLTLNEWAAIAHALGHTAETYRPDHGGVALHEVRERIEARLTTAWSEAAIRKGEK